MGGFQSDGSSTDEALTFDSVSSRLPECNTHCPRATIIVDDCRDELQKCASERRIPKPSVRWLIGKCRLSFRLMVSGQSWRGFRDGIRRLRQWRCGRAPCRQRAAVPERGDCWLGCRSIGPRSASSTAAFSPHVWTGSITNRVRVLRARSCTSRSKQ